MPRRSSSLTQVVDGAIDREINSKYDDVKIVADNIDDVIIVANATATTAAVAASIGVVTAVGSNIDAVVNVHNNTANIATIIDNFTNMNTVVSNIADVSAVANSIEAVDTVNDNMASIHTTVANIANVGVVAGSITGVNIVASGIADILTANSNIADITVAADNIAHINQVAADTAQINEIVATVVPNMAEILLADDRAATATSMAVTATTQAGLANTARVAAEVAKGIAETKATEAGLSAVAADLSADLAAVSEGIASTKADEAVVSAAAAHTSELAAAALLDAFDDRYLGSYSVDPALDNDGQELLDGTLYYNTVSNVLKVYDTSSITWYTIPQVMLSALLDVQLTSVATGDVLSWNGSKWVNTKALTVNSVQLLGGISTQGTMTWNADEETVDVVQYGAVLQLGQETQVHVRNNSGSSIADGKVVMATGTLGASGRITAGLYDGAADVKYVLGVATETIANGDDGKVTSFGKIRGINTSAWNEGDVLYATAAGGLTNVAPVTGVKLAVAMVITKHAVNGVIMVRVNGVDELRYEPKNVNIQAHVASTSNPHGVTKTQVGLGNVDNTADSAKNVLSATKWNTGRTLTIGSTGKSVDGSANVSWSLAEIGAQAAGSYQPLDATLTALAGVTTAADKLVYATGVDAFTTTALTAAGRALLDDTDAAAQRTTLGISATNTPSTAVGGIAATNVQAAIAELDSEKVAKVASTDNAIARFNGTTGAIQNSSVVVDDSGNVGIGTSSPFSSADGVTRLTVSGTSGSTLLFEDTGYEGTGDGVGRFDYDNGSLAWLTGSRNGTSTTSSTERMRIDSSGNIGVGVTPSAWYSDFKPVQIGNYGSAISGQTNAEALKLWNNAYPNASNIHTYTTTGAATTYVAANGSHAWYTAPSGTAGNPITWTTAMALDINSNLAVTGTVQGTQLKSTIANGTAPLVTASTTLVTNLNADLLDGNHASAFATSGHTHSYEAPITAGTAAQYYRGDKTWATMPTSLPASDVYTWAKASVKPSYIFSEIGTKPTTLSGYGITDASLSTHTHNYAGSSSAGGAATTALACTGNAATATKSTNLAGGNSTTLLGAIPYQSNADTTLLLSPNTSTIPKALVQTGTGTNGAVPVWTAIEDRLGTSIASGATVTIGTAGLGDYIHITGTTTITSFGTAATAGIRRTLIFDGILTLTHNATSLICIGDANIVTSAGMVIEVVAETTANWRVVSITKKSVIESKVTMAANNIDLSAGSIFTKTVAAITTFTVSGVQPTGNANSFILELTNGGAYAVTWWSGIKWAGGTVPTLTASGVDILGFYSHDGGTTYRGIVLAKDSK